MWIYMLISHIEQVHFFSFCWALQTLQFSQKQKDNIQQVFWLSKNVDAIKQKYFQNRKHTNGTSIYRH